jgi:threonine efflux protein
MLTTLIAISLLHWVVLVTPGANVLVVSQLAASGQRRAACFAALGVSVVALLWSALALLGVNAVFAAHPHLRFALQFAGGLYLCFVALKLWRSGGASPQMAAAEFTASGAFRLGFVTNILNPKSALFFGSVFATLLPAAPSAALLAAAVGLVLFNALVWHLFLALAFSHPRVMTAYARYRGMLNRFASLLVGTFGLRLLANTLAELRTHASTSSQL